MPAVVMRRWSMPRRLRFKRDSTPTPLSLSRSLCVSRSLGPSALSLCSLSRCGLEFQEEAGRCVQAFRRGRSAANPFTRAGCDARSDSRACCGGQEQRNSRGEMTRKWAGSTYCTYRCRLCVVLRRTAARSRKPSTLPASKLTSQVGPWREAMPPAPGPAWPAAGV